MEVFKEIKVYALSPLVLRSRKHLIPELKNDSEFADLYRFLEDTNGISI